MVRFIHPDSALIVDRIRSDDSVFRVCHDVLEVTRGDLETFQFYIQRETEGCEDESGGYVILMDEKADECPVCYEYYVPTLGSKCGHSACIGCMKKMYENNLSQCPLCRSSMFAYPVRATGDAELVTLFEEEPF
jgi:hypothetical protein